MKLPLLLLVLAACSTPPERPNATPDAAWTPATLPAGFDAGHGSAK